MYKLKLKACENFQTIETEIEVKNISEAALIMVEMRKAILVATQDISDKQPKKEQPAVAPVKVEPKASPNQINFLLKLGVPEDEARKMTKREASDKLASLGY